MNTDNRKTIAATAVKLVVYDHVLLFREPGKRERREVYPTVRECLNQVETNSSARSGALCHSDHGPGATRR